MKHTKRNLGIMALAILCVYLAGSVTPVVKATETIVMYFFSLSAMGLAIGSWLANIFLPPPAGVTADSHLSLFYHAKDNEFRSLTTTMLDQSSSIDVMGYYLGRKTEYAAMSYLNNTLYPTYPKWQILNASILPELIDMQGALIGGYTSSVQDAVRYAKETFTGALNGLDLQVDASSVKAMTNDFEVLYGFLIDSPGHTINNVAYVVTNNSMVTYYGQAGGSTFYTTSITLTDVFNASNTITFSSDNDHGAGMGWQGKSQVLPYGIWNISTQSGYENGYDLKFFTNGLLPYVDATHASNTTAIYSQDAGAIYNTLNFHDTSENTYTISMTNTTQTDMAILDGSIDSAVNFANSLANAYWTVLRNAGIYDISDIPPNLVIPLPDFVFMSNEDMLKLNEHEIMAMYLAYLKALGNFFNSSTYQTILNTSFSYANVTFANLGVIVDGFLYRNNTLYTNGSLYIQVYADMDLVIGNNTLNSSGLVYNLNDTSCFSYASGDILNATEIWVRASNGTYYSVTNASIKAQTIVAYLYQSDSGPLAEPTGGSGGGGGGGGGGLLIIIAVLVLLLIARGNAKGSGNPINVIMPKSKATASVAYNQTSNFIFQP
jgi:hypothetical protein